MKTKPILALLLLGFMLFNLTASGEAPLNGSTVISWNPVEKLGDAFSWDYSVHQTFLGNGYIYWDGFSSKVITDLDGNVLFVSDYFGISELESKDSASVNYSSRYGLFLAQKAPSGQGVVDSQGTEVVPCEYVRLKAFDNNWLMGERIQHASMEPYDYTGSDNLVIISNDFYRISEDGQIIAAGSLSRQDVDPREIYAVLDYIVIKDRSGSWHSYDENLNRLRSSIDVKDYEAAKGYFYNAATREVIFIPTGEALFRSPYSLQGEISDENARLTISLSTDKGFYDLKGNLSILPQYESIGQFYGGFALVKNDKKKCGLIDYNGIEIVPCEFDEIRYHDDNKLYQGYFAVINEGKFGYIDQHGLITCPVVYDKDLTKISPLFAVMSSSDGSFRLISANGGLVDLPLAEVEGYRGHPSCGAIAAVKAADASGLWGAVDWLGNKVVDFKYPLLKQLTLNHLGTAAYGDDGLDRTVYHFGVETAKNAQGTETVDAVLELAETTDEQTASNYTQQMITDQFSLALTARENKLALVPCPIIMSVNRSDYIQEVMRYNAALAVFGDVDRQVSVPDAQDSEIQIQEFTPDFYNSLQYFSLSRDSSKLFAVAGGIPFIYHLNEGKFTIIAPDASMDPRYYEKFFHRLIQQPEDRAVSWSHDSQLIALSFPREVRMNPGANVLLIDIQAGTASQLIKGLPANADLFDSAYRTGYPFRTVFSNLEPLLYYDLFEVDNPIFGKQNQIRSYQYVSGDRQIVKMYARDTVTFDYSLWDTGRELVSMVTKFSNGVRQSGIALRGLHEPDIMAYTENNVMQRSLQSLLLDVADNHAALYSYQGKASVPSAIIQLFQLDKLSNEVFGSGLAIHLSLGNGVSLLQLPLEEIYDPLTLGYKQNLLEQYEIPTNAALSPDGRFLLLMVRNTDASAKMYLYDIEDEILSEVNLSQTDADTSSAFAMFYGPKSNYSRGLRWINTNKVLATFNGKYRMYELTTNPGREN